MTEMDRTWTTQDTIVIKRFGSLDPSLDGKSLVFTVVQAVMAPEKSGYLAQIFLADDQGTSVEQLTTDERSSYDPQWSPDGKSIAYLYQNPPCAAVDRGSKRGEQLQVVAGWQPYRVHCSR